MPERLRRIDLSKQARELGVELEDRPSEMVVVTGFAALTPLGNTEETRRRELLGDTAVDVFDTGIERTRIAAHTIFDPEEHGFDRRDLMRTSKFAAMMQVVAREAAQMAGILDENGKLRPDINRDLVGVNTASGFSHALNAIDVYNARREGRRIPTWEGLRVFPEQPNAGITQAIGLSGWGGNSSEACASGLSSIADANLLIRSGKNRIMISGGGEDVFSGPSNEDLGHPEIAMGVFAALTAVSKRNDDPKRAMRPFDRDRDGFVMGSGGAALVLESIESARQRGATIYARIVSAEKGMDGDTPTNVDSDRVARLIIKTLKDRDGEGYYPVDAIFAHATSTKAGDLQEAQSLRKALEHYLPQIPVTAIKSVHGHLLGGAGAINAIAAIRSLCEGEIPPTINLENRAEEFADLDIVTKLRKTDIQTALALAYGFGGFDAAVLFEKWS